MDFSTLMPVTARSAEDKSPNKSLGKDDFLNLFVSQLRYQDPLNPMDSVQFTAQLAQFSSLEQLYNVNDNFKGLLMYQGSLNNGLAANLIGRKITWGEGLSGTVTGISLADNVTYLLTDGGQKVALGEVKEIYAQ